MSYPRLIYSENTLKTNQNFAFITLFKRRKKPQNVLNISRDTSNVASDTLYT